MKKELLVEIGVEELPAIPFLKELPNITEKWEKILIKYNLDCEFEFFYTPRRLVFIHKEFLVKQNDIKEEIFGAPLSIAYKDGSPTNAFHGFIKKCGIKEDEVQTITKDGKEVLFYSKVSEGKKTSTLLGDMIEEFLDSLNFGKSMRWGKEPKSFIRPIRWFNVLFEDEKVEFEKFGVKNINATYPHRNVSYEARPVSNTKEYLEYLHNNGVILDQNQRKKIILDQFETLMQKNNFQIEIDTELLDEIVSITEYPNSLVGSFDKEFLKVPSEAIIGSMKEHQRYFPIFKNDTLTNQFIVVSNSLAKNQDLIARGNEKVLHARLSDAMFFYENDLKNGLNPDSLKDIIFMNELGSLHDKILREQKIADVLYEMYKENLQNSDKDLLQRAILLCKADLNTEMVIEFDKLQGTMGSYYASHANEDEKIVLALKEQYLPKSIDSKLPSTLFSSIVAMSSKLDSLFSLFSIGKIPTGTKDPFALRRATLGVIKIVLEYDISFDFIKCFEQVSDEYKKFDTKELEKFILERLNQHFDANPSIISSVINTGEKDIKKISNKVGALSSIAKQADFSQNFSTFKRVSNIIKDLDLNTINVNVSLLEIQEEKNLYEALQQVITTNTKILDYTNQLQNLFNLKPQIDDFFDNVMVNVDDKNIKSNRYSLVGSIYKEFLNIADIKEVSV